MPESKLLNDFASTITFYSAKLAELDEEQAGVPLETFKWSRKQILGHLIDSASNNHQRFVRAASSELVRLPGYDQNLWVETQNYSGRAWVSLIQFWRSYNEHLLHTLGAIPESALSHRIEIGDHPAVTLSELAADYLRHLQHHLRQIAG